MVRALIPFLLLCSSFLAPVARAQSADLVRQVVKEMSDARFRPRAWAKELGAGKTVVAVLCDTGERYLSHPLYAEMEEAGL